MLKALYFLTLKALQGGGVVFGDGKKRYVFFKDMFENSMEYTIEDVYYVNNWSTIFQVFHIFVMNEIMWSSY